MSMEFVALPRRPDDWDERIAAYDTKTLFHESPWHDHVLTIHPHGRFDYFEIRSRGECVGYHCALRIRKMLLPISGSPLGGTGTNFMGPVVNHDVDQRELARALVRTARRQGYLHMEVSHYWLDEATMIEAGFRIHRNVTHLIKLPGDEEAAWSMLKGTCRNRARKAEKQGCVAEITDDPSLVDHYQEQFAEVYAKQHMAVPYTKERPRSLFDCLLPAKRILPVWVRREGEVVACGLFPYDERCIYFWGAASWLKFHKLCPNELLHWTVIRHAIEMGIPAYNMCGGKNQFKNKFGGEDVPYVHYSKSAIPFMNTARNLYRKLHFWRLKHARPAVSR